MELGDIIKWVDDLGAELANACFIFNFVDEAKQEIMEIPIKYEPEYPKYTYALIDHILHLDIENKKALFKRLFRNSDHLFQICINLRKEKGNCRWLSEMEVPVITLDERLVDESYTIPLYEWKCYQIQYELFEFYKEAITLCKENELNPNDFIIPEANEVVEDMGWHSHMTIIEKLYVEKLLPPTKWQDYIIGDNKEKWVNLITREIGTSERNGKLMASIILALQKDGSIKHFRRGKLYKALRVDFPNLNSDESINKYLNANSANSIVTPITEDEKEDIIKKVGCY